MRSNRTKEEDWSIEQLVAHLASEKGIWEIDDDYHDAPDLVLTDRKSRVACEISGVGINKWHRWSNDPKLQLDIDELDSIAIPREADLWVQNTIAAKNPKIPAYLKNANATEAWLLVHGGLLNDFFVLDGDDYDVPLMQQAASSTNHQFSRIYIASPASKKNPLVQIYPAVPGRPPAPDLSEPGTMKVLEIRSIKLDASNSGVVTARLGTEFKPDRQILLPPLDPSRGKFI